MRAEHLQQRYVRFHQGPSISGEAVGSGESSKQLLSNSGGKSTNAHLVWLHPQSQVLGSITFKPEFYDEVTMQYGAMPSMVTYILRRITVWSLGVVAAAGFAGCHIIHWRRKFVIPQAELRSWRIA